MLPWLLFAAELSTPYMKNKYQTSNLLIHSREQSIWSPRILDHLFLLLLAGILQVIAQETVWYTSQTDECEQAKGSRLALSFLLKAGAIKTWVETKQKGSMFCQWIRGPGWHLDAILSILSLPEAPLPRTQQSCANASNTTFVWHVWLPQLGLPMW